MFEKPRAAATDPPPRLFLFTQVHPKFSNSSKEDTKQQITDTRAVQTDGPTVYPCLTAAPLSRSVESYLSDIPPIQEAQA